MSGTMLTYGAFSDYLEKRLLDHVFGAAAYTRPTALYVALYTTPSSDTVPGTEPIQANGYARVVATFVVAPDQPDGSSAMWNPAVLQFQVASAAWGVLTHCGIHDALTGGNLLASGPLAASKTVDIGDAVRFQANTLLVGLQ